MTNIDMAVFLAAGVVGAFWNDRGAWLLIALWALLKLLRVL